MGSASHGVQMQNLLRPRGKFTEQLLPTIITASTVNRQYYKMSVLYVPKVFRTTAARKHNLYCGHDFAVFPRLKPRIMYITIRRNMSEAV
jgi:hypothetical protein